MTAYRTPAHRPLPTFVLRSSASVTVTLLGLGVPTLAVGMGLPLHGLLTKPSGDALAQVMVILASAILLGGVLWVGADRWPRRACFVLDGNNVVIEWRWAGRLLDAQRLRHADLIDVVLQKSSTTVDHAGECDLVLRTRAASIALGYHASTAACESKAEELRAFLWSGEP